MVRAVAPDDPSSLPLAGELVSVRHRQYLVEQVHRPTEPKQMTRVSLVCLDDDDQGRPLEVLWELELGARRLDPSRQGLGTIDALDPPRHFAAYLHAIKWSCVTATNARLFQAPFRAGIQIFQHQLAPLRKALELPRANLFIADDVGLGKTVEAGLVMQELLLRQRLSFILIAVPASITLQWRQEMERRFGLHFEIYNRAFVARRRRERGFGVNPWDTHNRFIISYQTLRRPEYREPLLRRLGSRLRKSMLVLDEAHTVAPASAAKYAVDSNLTKMARDIAPRFENRLFLSATPHNGHSNSFSALLEILDPQRFTRGVKVKGPEALEPVMVRRLKKDLRAIGVSHFPHRRLVELSLTHRDGQWWQTRIDDDGSSTPEAIGEAAGIELQLAERLAEYARHRSPAKGRGRLVFINLQKRLLSSVEAFCRTLDVHARTVGRVQAQAASAEADDPVAPPQVQDEETYGRDDDTEVDDAVRSGARALTEDDGGPRADELLAELLELSRRHRGEPDAKALALLAWIRQHQCPAVALGGAARGADRHWSDRRLLVFTEYADTKRYLQQFLMAAVAGTDRAEQRIATLHGGMSDEGREEVQIAFNGDPGQYPLRVLIATDAAREGVNLQGQCADLIHFDVPWNPARIEQRNGRIDRTLQPAAEVRCMYFTQPQRPEDRVLSTLVRKVERIADELGSLSQVVMDRMDRVMADGIDERTEARLQRAGAERDAERTVAEELDSQRASTDEQVQRLREQLDECGQLEDESRRQLDFDPRLLRDAIDVSCELMGVGPLQPVAGGAGERGEQQLWTLPELPSSWARTLDSLRPPRARDEEFYQWRRRPLLSVAFEPGQHLSIDRVHLHLQHPFVQRALSRFLAQGTAVHDLSRVTVVRTRYTSAARVVAFGRLSLFGRGATRLHDRVIPVVAPWLEGKGKTHLQPFVSDADREALVRFEDALREAPGLDDVAPPVRQRLTESAPGDFATLWEHVEATAADEEAKARQMLQRRGQTEAQALREILDRQRRAIDDALTEGQQVGLKLEEADEAQQRQFRADQRHMQQRLQRLEREREQQPQEIIAGYEVVARRLEPLGLAYLWPHNR
ncbi:MAG: DISARM system SNF2-like helicase DrmD [Nannocystaceae bacterium]